MCWKFQNKTVLMRFDIQERNKHTYLRIRIQLSKQWLRKFPVNHIITGLRSIWETETDQNKGKRNLRTKFIWKRLEQNERREQTLGGASEPESLTEVDADPDDRLTLFFSAPAGFFISPSFRDGEFFFFRFFLQIQRFFLLL